MLEQQGIVIEVFDKSAIVQTRRLGFCGSCNKNCGLGSLLGQRQFDTLIKVANHQGAKVGDKVVLGFREQSFLISSVIFYLLPLLGFFGTAFFYEILVMHLGLLNSELLMILVSLLGLLMGFFMANQMFIKMSKDDCHQPMIVNFLKNKK
jgi:sigma-E factor negative regulatory protein RseC